MAPKVSDCCKSKPQIIGELDSEDLEICPNCEQPCEYLSQLEIDSREDYWIHIGDLPNED